MPVLPFDIVEIIIDLLAQDDSKLLSTKACSLVCRDFLPICRKRIFHSIVLNDQYNRLEDPSPTDWIQRATTPLLQELLDDTPEIADHIRDLRYFITLADLQNLSLVQTFKKITRLGSLHIWLNLIRGQFLWDDNPLRPALLHLLRLPSLTKLDLFGIYNFVLTDLAPCINLENFVFGRLTTTPASPPQFPDSPIGFRTISVGVLSISTVTQMCDVKCTNGKPFIDFNRLTHISMEVLDSDDVKMSRKLFSHCKQLIDVRIEVLDSALSLTGLFNLLKHSMQTLKGLYVSTMFSDQNDSSDPLCGLANELEHMGDHGNVVEDLAIEIFITVDSECARGDEWGRLDKALSQSGWAKLRRVSLVIIVSSHAREDDLEEELQELPETQLKWLSSNESLSFEFKVTEELV